MIMQSNNLKNKLYLLLLAVFLFLFWVFNQYTFLFSDDYSHGYSEALGGRYDSILRILRETVTIYFHWSGAFLPTIFGRLFCGYFTSKAIFNIANTIVFGVFLHFCISLILLINRNADRKILVTILFAALWYLCCPVPSETMFWISGTVNYLWNCTLCILFIFCFMRYADKNSSTAAKLMFATLAFLAGTTNFISTMAIAAALLLDFVLHRKNISGNRRVLYVGFLIGALVLFCAPGNLGRFAVYYGGFDTLSAKVKYAIHARILTFSQYRAVYLCALGLLLLRLTDKNRFKDFVRENSFLLSMLVVSALAYSLVFGSALRSAIFPELIASIVTANMILCHLKEKTIICVTAALSILCVIDFPFALRAVIEQNENNEQLMAALKNGNGETCFETIPSRHRMANPLRIDSWSRYGICKMYDLEKVVLHPLLYCKRDEFASMCSAENHSPEIHPNAFYCDRSLILQIPDSVSCGSSISYDLCYRMPQLWHRTLRSKMHLFDYERHFSGRAFCVFSADGYNYYIIEAPENKGETFVALKTTIAEMP
ncbi:MAG: hypothetical protein J6U04_10860 [Salinivirgaceae bacterium]|nr:hypothetical protein [Salinivirgaceae bacterium]